MRSACAILLLAHACYGQLTGHATVAGTVIDATDNSPVRKAIVTLTLQTTPRTWATERTDAAGRFRFENLPAGAYNLDADKNQLGHASYGVERLGETPQSIRLSEGENHEGVRLRFIPSSSVSGTVFDPDGQPLAGTAVQLLQYTRNLGERVLTPRATVVTNDRGEYDAANVNPGEYYVAVAPNPGQTNPFEPQFYGGGSEAKDATPIHLRASQSLDHADFHLIAAQLGTIHGRLLGVPDLGPPVPEPDPPTLHEDLHRVQVQVNPDFDGITPRGGQSVGTGPPDYSFSIDVVPGRYRFQASAGDSRTGTWTVDQYINAHQDPGEILLTLQPSIDIKGTLEIEGPGTRKPQDFGIFTLTARTGAQVETDGTFTLSQVSAGEWAVNVSPMPRGVYLKSMRFGSSDKDLRFERIPMGGDANGPLKIVVSTRVASVSGSVDGFSNNGPAGIVLAPTGAFHDFARFYYDAQTDDEGKFKIEDVAPGTYRIFALEKLTPANFRNPETTDRLKDLGTDIELAEGASVEVHPKLIPTEQAREALDPELR